MSLTNNLINFLGQKRIGNLLGMLGGDDPSKSKKPATYQTQDEVDKANQLANSFAQRRNQNAAGYSYVAKKIGDPVVPFVDQAGNPYSPLANSRPNNYSPIVPNEVTNLEYDDKQGLPYYIDPHTGDMVYTDQSYLSLPRFRKQMPLPMVAFNKMKGK